MTERDRAIEECARLVERNCPSCKGVGFRRGQHLLCGMDCGCTLGLTHCNHGGIPRLIRSLLRANGGPSQPVTTNEESLNATQKEHLT
jgi:hypothetical protein